MAKKRSAPRLFGLVALVLLGLGVVGLVSDGQEINFVWRLVRAYTEARRFYARYPYLERDVVFDPTLEPRLDVYRPAGGQNYPVLVFVHGGSWKDYTKELFALVAMKLVPEGMVVVVPDYTLYPGARYEQMAHEVAAALAWTLENIDDYGGDPRRVVVAGHSAGGHLAALALLDPRFLESRGHPAREVRGFVGLSGVYDVQAEYDFWAARGSPPELIVDVMGGRQNLAQASPISFVRSDLPPILLIHGTEDETVPAGISVAFDAALRQAGARSRLQLYEGAAHSDYLLDALSDKESALVADLLEVASRCDGERE